MSMEQLYRTVKQAQVGDFDFVLRKLAFKAQILARVSLVRRGVDWRSHESSTS